jgi:hypothetical protein
MGRTSMTEKQKRRGKTVAAMTRDRNGAIEQMNSNLRRKFKRIEKSVSDLRADNLRYYWNIGELCEEIRENPEQYVGDDGTPGLKLVEQALATQARTLRKASKFAKEYSKDQLEDLIALKNESTSYQLHWGHVSFLLTLDETKRERYTHEAIEKMLDPPALHALIKKRTQRSKGHGRTHAMPKTVPAQIRQIKTICEQWLAKNEMVWNGSTESVYGNIMNLSPEEMEPDMVADLELIETAMQHISEQAATNVATTRRAKEFLTATIAARDTEAEREANRTTAHARSIDLDGAPSNRGRRPRTGSAA